MWCSPIFVTILIPARIAGRQISYLGRQMQNSTASDPASIGFTLGTTPYANLTAFTSPKWTTLPLSVLETITPFCENEADPDQGVGNYCVCKNGATVAVIPITGQNVSDYQPCAYTTVDTSNDSSSSNGSWVPGTLTAAPRTTVAV